MKHVMKIMTEQGDERLDWYEDDKASVKAARKKFDKLKAKGHRFYEAAATKGKEIFEFDPSLQTIIAAPQATGGPVAARS